MSSFDFKESIEDFVKDGLTITATVTGMFFTLKEANVKTSKASLDPMGINHETCWWNIWRGIGKRL